MNLLRAFSILLVFAACSIAWMTLGGITKMRAESSSFDLAAGVDDLWGTQQTQLAPLFVSLWSSSYEEAETVQKDGGFQVVTKQIAVPHEEKQQAKSTHLKVDIHMEQRRKGLNWYSLYDVDFSGNWTYTHESPDGSVRISWTFPDPNGIYDDFRFLVNGKDMASEFTSNYGAMELTLPAKQGQSYNLAAFYTSRGQDQWSYKPSPEVANTEDFSLSLTTNFQRIDFPTGTLSPTSKERDGDGWKLVWTFDRLVGGRDMGVSLPQRIQPGELASELSFSAPISLGFFLVIIILLSLLQGLDIHPVNYALLAASFFAFHLLFAYSVDHLPVGVAFALASFVSVGLVVSYLRLVVSPRFAFREAALAQLLYLVGFSLAHFWKGYTGLTVTVLSIITLGVVMQTTGRLDWSELLSRGAKPKKESG